MGTPGGKTGSYRGGPAARPGPPPCPPARPRLTHKETNIDWNTYNNQVSATILNANRLDDLLRGELGCDFKQFPGGHLYRGRCPVHGGDNSNLQLRTDGDVLPIYWACYSQHCERVYKPSLLGLVRGILSFQKGKKAEVREAKALLDEFVAGLPVVRPAVSGRQTNPNPKPNSPAWSRAAVRRRLVIPSPYFLGRGFARAVLDQMDVGHSPKLGRSVVPLYDDTGLTCIGFATRREAPACPKCGLGHEVWEECGKHDDRWRISKGFTKASYLYNYAAARQSALPFVVLVEGAGEVWRLAEINAPAVACLGNDVTRQQAEKLAALHKAVFIAFDNDLPGLDGSCRVSRALSQRGVEAVMLDVPRVGKDVADLPAEAAAAWLRSAIGKRLAAAWPGGGAVALS